MSAPFNSDELKILWNIKANEVLIQALKRSPPREHNLLWLASLAQENSELKSRSLLYEPFQIWVRKYNPDQPRVPAGNSDGGQWTDEGGSGVTGGAQLASGHGRFGGAVAVGRKPETGPKAPDGTPATLVQSRGGGRSGSGPTLRRIAGRSQEITPTQAVRLSAAQNRKDAAVRTVQQRDPNWRPQARVYENVEGEIAANENIGREANERLAELNEGVNIRGSFIPYGFVDQAQCTAFGSAARSRLAETGIRDASIHLRGSAVTGRNSQTKTLHDGAKRSDLDVAIASETLFRRAEGARIGLWGKVELVQSRLKRRKCLRRSGLLRLRDAMAAQARRKVSFVIFRSREDIRKRGEFATLEDFIKFIRENGD
ncbi:hypothetical protein [Phyllobacterium bourgognense]|uniref:Uncharacterized protein n=1 Tax=Phyllobacterium bourgognense TaxID=314236 RepID=A0A368YH48_9HYPH|nr:hypothetical protein [Phyllobacterium bourgognense]RCW79552.1 hypothetical protein C7476_11767 [Phyllobacterium bourgognense]